METIDFLGHYLMGMPLATMGVQSFGDKTRQLIEQGYDINTAIANGAATATLSVLTEKLPLDSFSKLINSNVGQFSIGAIATQAINEGLEEDVEAIVEPIIDSFILGGEVEYNPNDIFMSVALGMATGGVLGFGGNVVPILRNQRSVNQLKADIQTLNDFRNNTNLSLEENDAIDYAIDVANEAIEGFKTKTRIGDGVQFVSDQVEPKNYQEIMDNLFSAAKPQSDFETTQKANAEYARQSLFNEAQNRLYQKGINMNVEQYLNLDDNTKIELDKLNGYAHDLKVNIAYDTSLNADGLFNPSTGQIVINPNSEKAMLSTFIHELTHGSESSKYYQPLKDFAKQYVNENIEGGWDTYLNYLGSNSYKGLSNEALEQETTAIAMQENLADEKFIKSLIKYNESLAYRIYDEIKHLVSKGDKYSQNIEYNFKKAFYDKENIVTFSDGVKFSKGEDFAKTIHNIATGRYYNNNNAILVDIKSPDWMVASGYEQLPMLMTLDHTKNAMGIGKGKNQHHISEGVLKYLPELIKHPIVAYKDKNDLIIFLKATDENGNVIKVAIKPNGRGYYESELLDSNFIKSTYGKESIVKYFDKVINDDNLIYPLGKNKKEVLSEILETQSLYNFNALLDNNISNFRDNVNKIYQKNRTSSDGILQSTEAVSNRSSSNDNILKSNEDVNKYSKGLSIKDLEQIKKIAPNSIDENGNIKDISRQLNEMEENPSSYDLVVVDTKGSLSFVNVDSEIYLTNPVYKKIKNKHGMNNSTISYLLDNIGEKAVLGLDYKDYNGKLSKCIILEDGNNYYILSTKKKNVRQSTIDGISSLYNKDNIKEYVTKSIEKGNKIYKNKKSDSFLNWEPFSTGTIFESGTTSKDNISNSNDDVKYSKGLSIKNINDTYGLKDDATLNELIDKVRTDIKEDGLVWVNTQEELANYIYENAKIKIDVPFKSDAIDYFKKKTIYLDPKRSKDIIGENMFEFNKTLPNGIKFTKNRQKSDGDLDSMLDEFSNISGYQFKDNTPEDKFSEVLSIIKSSDYGLMKDNVPFDIKQEIKYDIKDLIDDLYLEQGLEKHNQALDEYGAFDKGENPYRDVDITKETKEGNTNRFTRTMAESESLNDEQVDLLKSRIGEGDFAYKPISNQELVDSANKRIDRVGLKQAAEEFLENPQSSSRNVAYGEVLLTKLAKDGNNELSMKVAVKLAETLTEAGRTVQSARILKRLTPEGRLLAINRNLNNIQEKLDKKYKGKVEVTLNDDLQKELLNAKTSQEMDEVEEKIAKSIGEQIPPTTMDRLNAWRYLSMLGNPRTHIRNMVGNGFFAPIVSAKNTVATVIELATKQKERTKAFLGKEDKHLIDFGLKNFEEYKKSFEKNGKYDIAEMIDQNRDIFSKNNAFGRTLNKLSKMNSDLLDYGDILFSKRRYATSLASYMKANNLTENDINSEKFFKAQEYAYKESLKATYRDENKLANAINNIAQSNKGAKLLVDAVLPFKKTPMNVLRRGVEYSPIGLVTSLTKGSYDLKKGNITANEFIDNLSAGMTGSMIALLGYALASIGILNIDDDDEDRKQRFDEDLGEQRYSLDFPFGSYTIDWLSLAIMPLSIGAEFFNNEFKFKNVDEMFKSIVAIADPIFETSMLSGLVDAFSSYDKNFMDIIQSSIVNYVGQYFPTIGGQVARTIDPIRRTTYPNEGPIDKAVKKILNKIPFATLLNEPYINRKGEMEKQQDLGLGVVGRMLLNTISPGYYKEKSIDEYDEELYRLYESTSDVNSLPTSATKSIRIDGENEKLLGNDYTNYHKEKWSKETKYVNEFIDSVEYENMDDSERVKIIKQIRDYVGNNQKANYLKERGISFEDKTLDKTNAAIKNGVPLYEYFINKNLYKSLTGGEKRDDYISYLNGVDITYEAKNALYDEQYGDSSYIQTMNDFADYQNLSDKDRFTLKESSTFEGIKKDGKTVPNTKALEVRNMYEEMGQYDNVFSYMKENGLSFKDIGLTKTVANMNKDEFQSQYNKHFNGVSTNYQKPRKTSSRKVVRRKTMKIDDYNRLKNKINSQFAKANSKVFGTVSYNSLYKLLKFDNDIKDIFDTYDLNELEKTIKKSLKELNKKYNKA